ncbi:hypothetical protein LHP98_15085 [Rhodobacter sp. Har01]|uniref:sugar-transfer associated ATP-grasp domain-containing protein n=1 Tax=Rhodobacter sp. Har01 TaxID=2883999 RepID=UPI001D07AE2C|nr:sugar-transfer associated ATP-grasp domain-containing protein [Rhodobacter sp. Har01]MCB6179445.1 hypothetical protein [Rhodobacter sp. Har01]
MTQILSHPPKGRKFDYGRAVVYAAQQRGVAPWRIALEFLLLSRGAGKLTSDDYFLHGAWRPGLSRAERRAFVGMDVNAALNKLLNPPVARGEVVAMTDKLVGHALFTAAGLPQPRILAVAAEADPGEGLRWLDSPEATLAFLREPGTLPCFGKPVHGSLAAGAASLLELDSEGRLRLGDGKRVTPEDLVAEIWRDHSRGFLFQELVRPHPQLAALIGPVIGTLRVASVDAGSGPETLYTALKFPGVGAMVDSASGPLGGYAAIDAQRGQVLRAQDRRQMGGTDLEVNPVTGAPWAGAVLPDFAEALRLAQAAHRCVKGWGLLGVDILLSDRGPLVTEVNGNPHHASYQIAFARGVLNPDLLPKLRAVRERMRGIAGKVRNAPLP